MASLSLLFWWLFWGLVSTAKSAEIELLFGRNSCSADFLLGSPTLTYSSRMHGEFETDISVAQGCFWKIKLIILLRLSCGKTGHVTFAPIAFCNMFNPFTVIHSLLVENFCPLWELTAVTSLPDFWSKKQGLLTSPFEDACKLQEGSFSTAYWKLLKSLVQQIGCRCCSILIYSDESNQSATNPKIPPLRWK